MPKIMLAQPRRAWPKPHLKYTQIGTQIVLQGRVLSFPQRHLTKIFLQKCHQYCECKMYFVHRNVHEKYIFPQKYPAVK